MITVDSAFWVHVIPAINGLAQSMVYAGKLEETGIPVPVFLAGGGGALLGIVVLYIFSWLYRLAGSWLGGKGKSDEIRVAIAWSQVPNLVPIGIVIGMALLANKGALLAILLIVYILALITCWIWTAVLTIATVAEVHQFSLWRSFFTLGIGNTLASLGGLFLGLILLIVFAVAQFSMPSKETPETDPGFQRLVQQAKQSPAMNEILERYKSKPGTPGGPSDPVTPTSEPLPTSFEDLYQIPSLPSEARERVTTPSEPEEPLIDLADFLGYSGPVEITLNDGNVAEGNLIGIEGADVILENPGGIVNVNRKKIAGIRKKT